MTKRNWYLGYINCCYLKKNIYVYIKIPIVFIFLGQMVGANSFDKLYKMENTFRFVYNILFHFVSFGNATEVGHHLSSTICFAFSLLKYIDKVR